MIHRILVALVVLVAVLLGVLYVVGKGTFGSRWGPGTVTERRLPEELVSSRTGGQRAAARSVGAAAPKQILFGDLHVHTTYSTDAFMMSLSMTGGDGAYPVADACDFARFCSALDFWSINDHGLSIDDRVWRETVETMRQCNAVAGDPANPDVSVFLGWEWTQVGTTPDNHYGHKNVVLRHLDDARIPDRPISALDPNLLGELPSTFVFGLLGVLPPTPERQDVIRYFLDLGAPELCPDGVPVREMPDGCRDYASTPEGLFAKLDDWGHESIVIPHGTTWGFYTPHGSAWDKQLAGPRHDPERQTLIEVFSGHGSSEEYREWEDVTFAPDGSKLCPEPRPDYLPSCWRAGEIIRGRCIDAGEDAAECESRAAEARRLYVERDVRGNMVVPSHRAEDWLDSGQCRDCFQPAFNYRPKSSVQYIMALRNFDGPVPRSFRFGFMASSDNHSARPGTGYKEYGRTVMTEARFGRFRDSILGVRDPRDPSPRADAWEPMGRGNNFFGVRESERQASFFLTGGLIGVHAEGRSRDAVWEAMQRREVYGTSGPRMLLWFDLRNAPKGGALPMGSEVTMQEVPLFTVRAVGSLEQDPGCPEIAEDALGPERLERLCRGECYNPSDRRRPVTRVEVVRIRPQVEAGEPVARLIEDPWKVLPCEGDASGCVVHFEDPEFPASQRDALYYVRAIEAPSPAVAADPLRCEAGEGDSCVAVDPCWSEPEDDDCLAETEERAWSSPIFLGWAGDSEGG
jgi:hypothetical protein